MVEAERRGEVRRRRIGRGEEEEMPCCHACHPSPHASPTDLTTLTHTHTDKECIMEWNHDSPYLSHSINNYTLIM